MTKNNILFSNESESPTPTISKAEREQEIQKFYRAELIKHLTDWPSTQLEKQVGKRKYFLFQYNIFLVFKTF
jgi:hypothetical protein